MFDVVHKAVSSPVDTAEPLSTYPPRIATSSLMRHIFTSHRRKMCYLLGTAGTMCEIDPTQFSMWPGDTEIDWTGKRSKRGDYKQYSPKHIPSDSDSSEEASWLVQDGLVLESPASSGLFVLPPSEPAEESLLDYCHGKDNESRRRKYRKTLRIAKEFKMEELYWLEVECFLHAKWNHPFQLRFYDRFPDSKISPRMLYKHFRQLSRLPWGQIWHLVQTKDLTKELAANVAFVKRLARLVAEDAANLPIEIPEHHVLTSPEFTYVLKAMSSGKKLSAEMWKEAFPKTTTQFREVASLMQALESLSDYELPKINHMRYRQSWEEHNRDSSNRSAQMRKRKRAASETFGEIVERQRTRKRTSDSSFVNVNIGEGAVQVHLQRPSYSRIPGAIPDPSNPGQAHRALYSAPPAVIPNPSRRHRRWRSMPSANFSRSNSKQTPEESRRSSTTEPTPEQSPNKTTSPLLRTHTVGDLSIKPGPEYTASARYEQQIGDTMEKHFPAGARRLVPDSKKTYNDALNSPVNVPVIRGFSPPDSPDSRSLSPGILEEQIGLIRPPRFWPWFSIRDPIDGSEVKLREPEPVLAPDEIQVDENPPRTFGFPSRILFPLEGLEEVEDDKYVHSDRSKSSPSD